MNISGLINEFIANETGRLREVLKDPTVSVQIVSTRDLCAGLSQHDPVTGIRVIRSLTTRFILFAAIVVDLVAMTIIIRQMIRGGFEEPVIAIALVVLVIFSALPVYFIARSLRRSYRMEMSPQSFRARDVTINWKEVADTFVLRAPNGKGFESYLVFVTKSGDIKKFPLVNFSISDEKLSELIEHYKKIQ